MNFLTPNLTHSDRRWVIELREIRATDLQREVIDTLDPQVLGDVLELWLRVITPEAFSEPLEAGGRCHFFATRAEARHFRSSFGGRLLDNATATGFSRSTNPDR
jgi:hypothetical protein